MAMTAAEAAARRDDKASAHGTALITKACDILDLVGGSAGPVGVQDLVEATGLAKSTLYRIVSALTARGLLRSDVDGHGLALGYHFLDLAQNVWAYPDLVTTASMELRHLRDMTGETAYLAVLSGHGVVSMAKYVGAHANSSMTPLGVSKPLHCTSQGKAILAFLPQRKADRLIEGLRFEACTPHTITHPDLLRRQLDIIRQRGFSVDDQEIVLNARCVGAPVYDAEGRCVAAISVAGPSYRMTLERIEQLGPELIDAARRIGAALVRRLPAIEPKRANGWSGSGEASFHGGNPFWSARDKCLYWADRLAPVVYALAEGGQPRLRATLPTPIQALGPAPEGGVIVACQEGWFRLSSACEGPVPVRADCPPPSVMRAAPDGTLWVAVNAGDKAEIGVLSPSLGFAKVWTVTGDIDDLVIAPDSNKIFAADGQRGLIHEFCAGRATPHILARIARGSGEPRGIALDADGRPWVALWDGWSLAQLDEVGEISGVLALPVPRPTGLTFGGADGKTLFVTTARLGLSRDILENAPLSGRLLVLGGARDKKAPEAQEA
ncbi:DNA-binding IclR family transcriptional regulator/sugar lactone lactonase YvrE [Rhodoblastus sphagnicola]|nr:IclR family transcriptional regulator C-terminal domain-containing protein [Rhodoblastus sphagnicola]MBB4199465.1 DNA-binding IclR family transcriptional regulator/sugar lactone lactonase YvrE [Rhodoblastus sphagnicola]